MADGANEFDFVLDNLFFKNIDGLEFQKGDVKAQLTVIKSALVSEFIFKFDGIIKVPCDRCLDEMELPVSTKGKLFVKLGAEYSEESDDTVIIPKEEGTINIAWFLYEFIALAIPVKHVHPAGKCNKTVSSKLKKHMAQSDEEGDLYVLSDDEDESVDTNQESETDPRWDELKKLIDNN